MKTIKYNTTNLITGINNARTVQYSIGLHFVLSWISRQHQILHQHQCHNRHDSSNITITLKSFASIF